MNASNEYCLLFFKYVLCIKVHEYTRNANMKHILKSLNNQYKIINKYEWFFSAIPSFCFPSFFFLTWYRRPLFALASHACTHTHTHTHIVNIHRLRLVCCRCLYCVYKHLRLRLCPTQWNIRTMESIVDAALDIIVKFVCLDFFFNALLLLFDF